MKDKVIHLDDWKNAQESKVKTDNDLLSQLGITVDSKALFQDLREEKRKEHK